MKKTWIIKRKDNKNFIYKYGGDINESHCFIVSNFKRAEIYLKGWLKLNEGLTFEDFIIEDFTKEWAEVCNDMRKNLNK